MDIKQPKPDDTLSFGMFKGRKVSEIIDDVRGASWLLWAHNNVEFFNLDRETLDKARDTKQRWDLHGSPEGFWDHQYDDHEYDEDRDMYFDPWNAPGPLDFL